MPLKGHSLAAVFEGWVRIHINWHLAVTRREAWLARLNLTLETIRLYLVTTWRYARYTWRVSSSRWGTVSVLGLNSNWVWNSYEVFLRLEGNRASQWVQGVGPDFLAILSSWNASFSHCFTCHYKLSWLICINLDWHIRMSWREAWGASLTCPLQTTRCRWATTWSNSCHDWGISSSRYCPVDVLAYNCYWVCCPDEGFFRYEGHSAIFGYRVSSLPFYLLLSRTIFESSGHRVIHWYLV